jgi:hypothetical protein
MFQRIIVNLKTEFVSDDKMYDGIIQNLSKNRMMVSADTKVNISPEKKVEIKYNLSSKETLNIYCKVRWYTIKNSSQDFKFSMGLEIINPPQEYKDFIKTLLNKEVKA